MNTQNAAALPDADTAFGNLFQGVHQRVVLDTLAARGHAPRTVKQAHWMLEIASQVAAADESAAVKQAEDAHDPYYQAHVGLAAALQQRGIADPVKEAAARDLDHASRRYAAQLAQDPTIYNSVLALKAAEARDAAAELGLQV